MRVAPVIELSPEERVRLDRWAKEESPGARALRARIVLAAAAGAKNQTIARAERISRLTVARWRDRFRRFRLAGLEVQPRGPSASGQIAGRTVRAIVQATLAPPSFGPGRRSTRALGREYGVSHMTVRRIWQAYGVRPTPYDPSPVRPDPVAALRPADVLGVYLDLPDAALLLSLGPPEGHPAAVSGRYDSEFPPTLGGASTRSRFDAVVPLELPNGTRRPPAGSSIELGRFLGGVDRLVRRGAPMRLIVTGPTLATAPWSEPWMTRHPRVEVVRTSDWGEWRARAIDEVRQLGRRPARSERGRNRGEVAYSLAKYLRDYSVGSGAFVWSSHAPKPVEELAAHRLRYDLAVTGHPGFKSPVRRDATMSSSRPPDARAREMARNVLRRCLRVRKGERVTIDAWSSTLAEANAFVLEALELGARPLLLFRDEPSYWASAASTPREHLGAMGEHVRAAVGRTDALVSFFGPSDRERFHALSPDVRDRLCRYDDALYAAAARAGVRAVQMAVGRASAASARMYGVNLPRWRRELVDGALVDPAELRRRGEKLVQRLAAGRELRITHPNGTEIRLRLRRRRPILSDGEVGPAERKGAWNLVTLPAGVVTTAIDERYAEGVFRSNVRSSVGLSNAVGDFLGGRWTFVGGRLTRSSYDEGAATFEESYANAGPRRDRPGSIAVGLNPWIATAPLLEDQGVGTITLHIGRNVHLGGTNTTSWWAWLYLRGGDLYVDGDRVVTRGRVEE